MSAQNDARRANSNSFIEPTVCMNLEHFTSASLVLTPLNFFLMFSSQSNDGAEQAATALVN